MKRLPAFMFLAGLAAAGFAAWRLNAPRELPAPVTVMIEPGTGARGAAARLAKAGVVDDARWLRLALRLSGGEGKIKSGEYEFAGGHSAREAAAMLVEGKVKSYRITLAPGQTVAQLLAAAAAEKLLPPADEKNAAELSDRFEGRLKPETYLFVKPLTAGVMLDKIAAAYDPFWTKARIARLAALGLTRRDAEIRASIIEKETAVPAERPLVSAVIANRLRRGMALQMDPTNIYGLTRAGRYGGNFGHAEVEIDTPWSSYHHAGLPPTAIGSPSPESLDAALNPADSDALYFVTDGRGGHRFTADYGEHRRNVELSNRVAPPGR